MDRILGICTALGPAYNELKKNSPRKVLNVTEIFIIAVNILMRNLAYSVK